LQTSAPFTYVIPKIRRHDTVIAHLHKVMVYRAVIKTIKLKYCSFNASDNCLGALKPERGGLGFTGFISDQYKNLPTA